MYNTYSIFDLHNRVAAVRQACDSITDRLRELEAHDQHKDSELKEDDHQAISSITATYSNAMIYHLQAALQQLEQWQTDINSALKDAEARAAGVGRLWG